ncbi:MAG: sirohydrochlorin chelatase [Pseudomonadota bacterium]
MSALSSSVKHLLKSLDHKNDGIMICGHGSRSSEAVEQFKNFAQTIKKNVAPIEVEYGFLEFAKPILKNALQALKSKGIKNIYAVPGMLFAAGHAKNDIPSVLNRWQKEHQDCNVHYARELAIDTRMIRAAAERVEKALEDADLKYGKMARSDVMLLVVGRGASDPDANSNVSKITRFLWEGLGLGWAETAYSGVTFPLVGPALSHTKKLGFKRIILFPYFLFTGILVDRIYQAGEQEKLAGEGIQLIKAQYLNDHPLVVETMIERVNEIISGTNNMNCQLCKYREQVLGFEDEIGLAQESHHHHVEGVGVGDVAHHHHGHHHHGHDHHHHPYPHANHPLGPRSLKS